MSERFPNEADAAAIISRRLEIGVRHVTRFTTGSANFVYEVETDDGRTVVARLGRSEQREQMAGALAWHRLLEPIGIPLAGLLGSGVDEGEAFPYLLLERLPGRDLAYEYASLSADQKRVLAGRIADIQARAGTLPDGPGYGFAGSYRDPGLHRSWTGVVQASLDRARSRIVETGLVSTEHVDRVESFLPEFRGYFDAIPPTPFLDDITTKNVIVHEGRLSGIVDIDWICFGDPLFTIGLTQTALLSSGNDTEYIGFWCDAMELSAVRRRVVNLYSALFCVDFLSEYGLRFNREEAAAVNPAEIASLIAILDRLLTGL